MKQLDLGKRLKQARIEKQMTQKEVAGDFITRNMLSQIENGLAMPSIKTIEYLAKQLNKPITYFMDALVDEDLSSNNLVTVDLGNALKYFCNEDYEQTKNALMSITETLNDSLPANSNELYYLIWKCDSILGTQEFTKNHFEDAKLLLLEAKNCEDKTLYCDNYTKMNNLLLLTKIALNQDDLENAEIYFKFFEEIYEKLNCSDDKLFLKCDLLIRNNKFEECKKILLDEATAANKNSFEYSYFMSILDFEAGNTDAAIFKFKKLLNLDTIDISTKNKIYKYIAECFYKKGDFVNAYEYMKKVALNV